MVRHHCRAATLVGVCAALLTGCPQRALNPPPIRPELGRIELLEAENDRLRTAVAEKEQAIQRVETENGRLKTEKDRLEEDIGRLQLQLLESEVRWWELSEEMILQGRRLDEAVAEVVRARAKRHSLESRAEAASSITEAEIALKRLKESGGATSEDRIGDEIARIEALQRMSTGEFQKENYGGALYLAGQTLSRIQALEALRTPGSASKPAAGEIAFTRPLALKVMKRSHLRAGPSLQAPIHGTLEAGSSVIGHAYRENWVRVTTEDGSRGWIFQRLVGGR